MSSLDVPKMPNGGQPGNGSSLPPKIHMPADGAADAVGKGATFAAKLKTYVGLIVAVGMVAAIVVVTAAVAGAFAGRPDDKDSGEPSDTPRREQPEYLVANPDFLGTVELLEPQWSDDLADNSSDKNRELSGLMEEIIDFIYNEGDTDNVFNYIIVIGFYKTDTQKVLVKYNLYLMTPPKPQLTEDEVETTFKDGYNKMLATKRKDWAAKVYASTNKVAKSKNTTAPTTTPTLPTPAEIPHEYCGIECLYPEPCDNTGNTARIVGGNAPRCPHCYPWVVMLTYNSRHLCGGAIWDSQHIVTAAHCIYGARHLDRTEILVDTTGMAVIVGKSEYGEDSTGLSKIVPVAAARIHVNFTKETFENDIAILKLEHPIGENQTTLSERLCHPEKNDTLPQEGIVAGWGSTRDGEFWPPDQLMEVTLSLYDQHDCNRLFGTWFDNGNITRFLHEGTFCAAKGMRGGGDACQGDSGGPLFARPQSSDRYHLFGIVSNGYGCGRIGDPGFYTFVPYHRPWIDDTIKNIFSVGTTQS